MAGGDALLMALAQPLLTVLARMLGEFDRLTKPMLDLIRGEVVGRRVTSVPGAGPIAVLAFRIRTA